MRPAISFGDMKGDGAEARTPPSGGARAHPRGARAPPRGKPGARAPSSGAPARNCRLPILDSRRAPSCSDLEDSADFLKRFLKLFLLSWPREGEHCESWESEFSLSRWPSSWWQGVGREHQVRGQGAREQKSRRAGDHGAEEQRAEEQGAPSCRFCRRACQS